MTNEAWSPSTVEVATDPTPPRARLGIPDDARQVLVLSESSHWDPDWMLTSDQYFRFGVRRTLDRVIDELEDEPRRVWSADCVFFLAMYWDRCPDRRERLAALVNSGRLRLTSSGVTTQDTLLPTTESILRDFLVGQEWLRTRGMTQEPCLAYFPDSFGHSPSLPSLLRAAGFDRTIVTRIDGGFFAGSDWELPGRFPRSGSSAELLTNAGSADFVWRDRQGSEVLAHWHPFTYGQADKLASVGILRYMSLPLTVQDRSERRVAARLERYAAKLGPLARTPYRLCPIGLDFVHPIPRLLDLIDRYNELRYPDSGLWVLNAGADEYLDLVAAHRDRLPVVELDPNPYWTGFYASRPELKRAHRSLVDALLATEAEAVVLGPSTSAKAASRMAEPWWSAVTGNHHDFITGTSPDRVARGEQMPWLHSAMATVSRVAAGLEGAGVTTSSPDVGAVTVATRAVACEWVDGVLRVEAGCLHATIDPRAGGCLTDLRVDGISALQGPAGDLVAYEDAGGLWRLGSEYRGGRLRQVDRTSRHPGRVEARRSGDDVVVTVLAPLDGTETRRTFRFRPATPAVTVDSWCAAGDRRTVTLALPGADVPTGLVMDQPGGVVARPLRRIFDPTLWPVSSWLAATGTVGGLALAVDMTRAVAMRDDGTVEVVVARNANKERAWRVLPILACPARGHEPGATSASVAWSWGPGVTPVERGEAARALLDDESRDRLADAVGSILAVEGLAASGPPSAPEVVALKPADRGDGMVLRVVDRHATGWMRVRIRSRIPLDRASRCDARERDLEMVQVADGPEGSELTVEGAGSVLSVRLVPSGQGPALASDGTP